MTDSMTHPMRAGDPAPGSQMQALRLAIHEYVGAYADWQSEGQHRAKSHAHNKKLAERVDEARDRLEALITQLQAAEASTPQPLGCWPPGVDDARPEPPSERRARIAQACAQVFVRKA